MTTRAPIASDGGERREQLLDRAEQAFGEAGFAGARVQDIAARAGIRRPSLLHHFRDKPTLYAAVLVRIVDDLADRVEATAAHGGLVRMEAVVTVWVEFLLERPNAGRVLLRHLLDPLPLDGVASAIERLMRGVQDAIDEGARRGENKPRDAAELALVLASTSLVWVSSRAAVSSALGLDTLAPERVATHRHMLQQLARQLLGAVSMLR